MLILKTGLIAALTAAGLGAASLSLRLADNPPGGAPTTPPAIELLEVGSIDMPMGAPIPL
jgi:hypothetical protein